MLFSELSHKGMSVLREHLTQIRLHQTQYWRETPKKSSPKTRGTTPPTVSLFLLNSYSFVSSLKSYLCLSFIPLYN